MPFVDAVDDTLGADWGAGGAVEAEVVDFFIRMLSTWLPLLPQHVRPPCSVIAV